MAVGRAEFAGGVLEIDLAGIVANWLYLSRQVAPAACAAVVKADAYGLGAPAVASALAGAGRRRGVYRARAHPGSERFRPDRRMGTGRGKAGTAAGNAPNRHRNGPAWLDDARVRAAGR